MIETTECIKIFHQYTYLHLFKDLSTADTDGRPIILCYAECISRAALNKYEIAKLLLYYTSIPTVEAREKGFTVLLLAENEADYKMIEVLDKSVCLLGNCIKVNRFLIWTPGVKSDKGVRTLASQVEQDYERQNNRI
ncbi:hypothetical protein D910_12427 [Dendroctonus ponderosae]|uniref:Uncharacterized protein n=1 Tax=Dendroctonus ponderosae TaxID=77166 RepID=U4URL8_DENPD|nr:hypothetical protein D910_12427 [Dendroctonus ponderosae]